MTLENTLTEGDNSFQRFISSEGTVEVDAIEDQVNEARRLGINNKVYFYSENSK